jgi:hypothetical protein
VAGIVQLHLAIHHVSEQTRPSLRTDGHEIRSRLLVIVSLQSDGTAPMDISVSLHGVLHLEKQYALFAYCFLLNPYIF